MGKIKTPQQIAEEKKKEKQEKEDQELARRYHEEYLLEKRKEQEKIDMEIARKLQSTFTNETKRLEKIERKDELMAKKILNYENGTTKKKKKKKKKNKNETIFSYGNVFYKGTTSNNTNSISRNTTTPYDQDEYNDNSNPVLFQGTPNYSMESMKVSNAKKNKRKKFKVPGDKFTVVIDTNSLIDTSLPLLGNLFFNVFIESVYLPYIVTWELDGVEKKKKEEGKIDPAKMEEAKKIRSVGFLIEKSLDSRMSNLTLQPYGEYKKRKKGENDDEILDVAVRLFKRSMGGYMIFITGDMNLRLKAKSVTDKRFLVYRSVDDFFRDKIYELEKKHLKK